MDARQALVSICIPSYNYARMIATAIESALDQDYPHFEIIISDNASTDDTRAVLARFSHNERVRVFHQTTNIGIARNVNFAVEQARGDYIVVVGADDAMLPNFLSACMARITDERDPVDLVYGGAIICNEHLRPVSVQRLIQQVDMPYSHRNEYAGLLQMVYILFTATLFKRSLFAEIGYLNAKTKIAFDWEFLLALAAADKRFASLPEPVIAVRYHADQASSSQGYFFSGHAFEECLSILEGAATAEHAWRFRGYEHRIIERLRWYDEMFRDGASLETLERYEAMVARLTAFAAAPPPARPSHVPRVSVIVVSDGDPGLLERALDSLEAQSYTSWEAVIVQHAGADLGALVRRRGAARRFRFSYGPATAPVARANAMELARGELVAHLHTDAVYLPEHLTRVVAALDAGPPLVIADAIDSFDQVTKLNYGPYRQARRIVSGMRDLDALRLRLHIAPVVDVSCVAHRLEILDTVGSLVIDQPVVSEWEFVLRAAMKHGLQISPVPTVELHHAVGTAPIERPLSFQQAIDEVYKAFPALDGQATAERAAFRAALAPVLQEQQQRVATLEGLIALTAVLTGLLHVDAFAAAGS